MGEACGLWGLMDRTEETVKEGRRLCCREGAEEGRRVFCREGALNAVEKVQDVMGLGGGWQNE